MSGTERQGRLFSVFQDRSAQEQGDGWSKLWENGEEDLWDRGSPSPAVIELLTKHPKLLNPNYVNGRQRRVFVPGCGRGYDCVMLALHGFDVYGLEVSSTAVSAAEHYAAGQMAKPSSYNFTSGDRNGCISPGSVTFIEGDFFQSDWESQLDAEHTGFDFVYDYTFLCALPPYLRTAWAERIWDLLRPGGMLICLEFPLWKDPHLPGPPWGMKDVYWNLLSIQKQDSHRSGKNEDPLETRGKFHRVLHMRPEVSYKEGRGEDMLSLWERPPESFH